jgi:hypothetical protein
MVSGELDINPVLAELAANSHLFGEFNARKSAADSPHSEMDDIWVRYGDISVMVESGDYTGIADEHDSIWLKDLPAVKRICFDVMALVDGERLGGVLITRLPAGGKIAPHSDSGWHAEYYDKFYVPIVNGAGSVFGFEGGNLIAEAGEVWKFDNSKPHWVNNDSNCERIAMIICIKAGGY